MPQLFARGGDGVGDVFLLEEAVRDEATAALSVSPQIREQDVVAAVERAQRLRLPLRGVSSLAVKEEEGRASRGLGARRRENPRERDRVLEAAGMPEIFHAPARAARPRAGLAFAGRDEPLRGDQVPREEPPRATTPRRRCPRRRRATP
jgi:hypothetical protein